jgi:hypothetical protein
MELPAGFEVEEPPYRRKAGLSFAGYEISFEVDGRRLTTDRELRLKGTLFPPEDYEALRNFFSVVQKGDESHAVLERGQDEKAKNVN